MNRCGEFGLSIGIASVDQFLICPYIKSALVVFAINYFFQHISF
jgi:hypothetical protein